MASNTLELGFSPCPNDTFIFYAWIHRRLQTSPAVAPVLADVQCLNQWAMAGKLPVTKLSFNCLGMVLDDYVLLPSGAALGRGCGPKLIAKEPFALGDLKNKRVAIPGRDTTAFLLLQCLADIPARHHFCTYEQILPLLTAGEVDCGLIIHETRFTFAQRGFVEIADLGEVWEAKTGLPLPLGGIAAKRALGSAMLRSIADAIRNSVDYAWRHPDECRNYILAHSQEKDPHVVQKHIDLYVNDETLELSAQGIKAIDTLFNLARSKELLPPCPSRLSPFVV